MMRREEEFNNAINELLKDPALLTDGNALKNFYLGYIVLSLAIIADELHEMNEAKVLREELSVARQLMNAESNRMFDSIYYPKEESKNECTDSTRVD